MFATAALTAANAAACAKNYGKFNCKINKKIFIVPKIFISTNEPGGGGNGKPLFVGNRIGTRPGPSVFIGNKPGGGGGKSDDGGRVKFGGGRRPNGDGKFIAEFVIDGGGKGNGHVELAVVVVIVVAVVVEVLSVVDVEFCVDVDGLVLFVEETVLVDSSLSVLSVESVSENRLVLIEK